MHMHLKIILPSITEYTCGSHVGWGGASYSTHQVASSQGHFNER